MKKIAEKNVGNLTVEVYDGNLVIKIKNALVKIIGHYKPPGHFKKSVSFSANTGLFGVVKFTNIPLDIYKENGMNQQLLKTFLGKFPVRIQLGIL